MCPDEQDAVVWRGSTVRNCFLKAHNRWLPKRNTPMAYETPIDANRQGTLPSNHSRMKQSLATSAILLVNHVHIAAARYGHNH